MTKLDNKGFKV